MKKPSSRVWHRRQRSMACAHDMPRSTWTYNSHRGIYLPVTLKCALESVLVTFHLYRALTTRQNITPWRPTNQIAVHCFGLWWTAFAFSACRCLWPRCITASDHCVLLLPTTHCNFPQCIQAAPTAFILKALHLSLSQSLAPDEQTVFVSGHFVFFFSCKNMLTDLHSFDWCKTLLQQEAPNKYQEKRQRQVTLDLHFATPATDHKYLQHWVLSLQY